MFSSHFNGKMNEDDVVKMMEIIPRPITPYDPASDLLRREIQHTMGLQLLGLRVDRKDEMVNEMKMVLERALVSPGEHVGITIAEANGQPVTQMNLKIFHLAGQITDSDSVNRYRDLIYATRSRSEKKMITKVHLAVLDRSGAVSYRPTFQQAYDHAYTMIERTVNSLVPGEKLGYKFFRGKTPSHKEAYTRRKDPGLPFLRIIIDRYRLYRTGLSLLGLAKIIEKVIGSVEVFPSSAIKSEIDIHVEDGSFSGIIGLANSKGVKAPFTNDMDVEKKFLYILEYFVLPLVKNVSISGTAGIINSVVSFSPLMGVIRTIQPHEGGWKLWIDHVALKVSGIPPCVIPETLIDGGFTVDSKFAERQLGVLNSGFLFVKRAPNGSELNASSPDEILKNTNYHYLQVQGGKYEDILLSEGVNQRSTICNDPHQIASVRGIEACRDWMESELFDILRSGGQSIAPRNIAAIPEFITVLGVVTPINSNGASAHKRGAFVDMTFENAMGAIELAAVDRSEGSATQTSASILIGRQVTIGTGAMFLRKKPEVIAELNDHFTKKCVSDILGMGEMILCFSSMEDFKFSSSAEIARQPTPNFIKNAPWMIPAYIKPVGPYHLNGMQFLSSFGEEEEN